MCLPNTHLREKKLCLAVGLQDPILRQSSEPSSRQRESELRGSSDSTAAIPDPEIRANLILVTTYLRKQTQHRP